LATCNSNIPLRRFSPFTASPSRNPWENTLTPEKLREAVAALGLDPAGLGYGALHSPGQLAGGFAQRPGDPRGLGRRRDDAPFRLFPGLDPADLPADADGFVRSSTSRNGFFQDSDGRWITGWRAVNFMPYGIFTPMTGSVSGIYIRCPNRSCSARMALSIWTSTPKISIWWSGRFRIVYARKMASFIRAQPKPSPLSAACIRSAPKSPIPCIMWMWPRMAAIWISPYPGTRARRVKEIRYMYKWKPFYPSQFRPGVKEKGRRSTAMTEQGWVDNGVGWYLAGYIEDKSGALRPQNREELAQCIGCHSGVMTTEFPMFTSGTGNTVDSTWSLPRKFPGELGWKEMDYLRYLAKRMLQSRIKPQVEGPHGRSVESPD
jgi:hypothetical protein